MDKMASWPQVLSDFRHTVLKYSGKAKKRQTPSVASSVPLHLLHLLGNNFASHKYTTIESNFLYAAMHIACMKDLSFANNTCPDLPDDIDGLIHK